MAQKRMFNLKIIDSARFLKMPVSAKLLYYDLGMRADDDGIVEGYNVIKMTGCSEDDLKILVAKKFVTVLNDDLVSFITDWNEHNLIRPDRKIDSIYKDLLLQIVSDVRLIEARPRADFKTKSKENGQPMDSEWTADGQQMDSIGKVRLGKVRLDKDSIDIDNGIKPTNRFLPPTIEVVKDYCTTRNNNVDAEKFIDFYISKGWMIGKNKMKDWKATVRTWERSDNSGTNAKQDKGTGESPKRNYAKYGG